MLISEQLFLVMNVMNRFEKEMEHFPEGSKNHSFFKQLYKKLGPDFLKESVRKELNESHANLSGSIQEYFKYHIIYTAALKAVDCNQLEQNETARDNVELFHLNILKKYVHSDKYGEKLKFFEESEALFTKILENKQKSKSVKLFSKLVEDNINEFCIKVLKILENKVDLYNWEKKFDSSIKNFLPRLSILDSPSVRFNGIAPELQDSLSLYHKELTEGIEILNKLFELFEKKFANQLEQSKIFLDRSLHLKLRGECLELEIMASTYSKCAVKALKIIKSELEAKIEKSEQEINTLNDSLEKFQILGPEYEQLVEKYQILLENIQKQNFAIEHLKTDIASKQNQLE